MGVVSAVGVASAASAASAVLAVFAVGAVVSAVVSAASLPDHLSAGAVAGHDALHPSRLAAHHRHGA